MWFPHQQILDLIRSYIPFINLSEEETRKLAHKMLNSSYLRQLTYFPTHSDQGGILKGLDRLSFP